MHVYPDINPILIQFLEIKIYWYGLFYLISTIITYKLMLKNSNKISTLINFNYLFFYILISIIFGGKLGSLIYYNNENIISILKFWTKGRSFYGGLFMFSFIIFLRAKYFNQSPFLLTDIMVQYLPIGILVCKLGNFINCESYGKITKSNIGMIFPIGGPYARHPAQLYEALMEGFFIYILLKILKTKKKTINTSIFFITYGLIRFIIENFKNQYYFISHIPIDKFLSLSLCLIGILIYKKN